MPQEYSIPSENSSNLYPIYGEINGIFQSTDSIDARHQQTKPERVVNPIYKVQREISSSINEARKTLLDSTLFTESEKTKRHFMIGIAKMMLGGSSSSSQLEPLTEDSLRNRESSEVGSKIFGSLMPNETRREFAYVGDYVGNHDGNHETFPSWIFYQEKYNPFSKKSEECTLRYECRPMGVFRFSSDPKTENAYINGEELARFVTSTEMYHEGVMGQIYYVTKIEDNDVSQLLENVNRMYRVDSTENKDRLAA